MLRIQLQKKNNNNNNNHAKYLNIDDKISLFQNQLKNKHVYRIPLRYFSDIGKINFPTKIDYRIKLFLETKMEKLFESKSVLASTATIPATDVKIIFTKVSFIQYEQILEKNLRQYLETIMVSKKILRMGDSKNTSTKSLWNKQGDRLFKRGIFRIKQTFRLD